MLITTWKLDDAGLTTTSNTGLVPLTSRTAQIEFCSGNVEKETTGGSEDAFWVVFSVERGRREGSFEELVPLGNSEGTGMKDIFPDVERHIRLSVDAPEVASPIAMTSESREMDATGFSFVDPLEVSQT